MTSSEGLRPEYRQAIEQLSERAAKEGDRELVGLCSRALSGDSMAIFRCAMVLGAADEQENG